MKLFDGRMWNGERLWLKARCGCARLLAVGGAVVKAQMVSQPQVLGRVVGNGTASSRVGWILMREKNLWGTARHAAGQTRRYLSLGYVTECCITG